MEYVFFAGANGSGKSTLIKNMRSLDEYQGFEYICADEVEKALQDIPDKKDRMDKARNAAFFLREDLLQNGKDVIFESVASHPSHLADLDRIKEMGYKITTVYVTTESPEINLARIAKRGRDNDTYLTPERVKGRYERSLDLLSEFIKRSDMALAYDNSINYFAVFYKTPDGKNYLIGEKEWANRYIVEKLQQEGIRVFTAKDMDQETYVRLLNQANRLIEPTEKSSQTQHITRQAKQARQAEQAKQAEQTSENKGLSGDDQIASLMSVCKGRLSNEIARDQAQEQRQAEQARHAEQVGQVRQAGAKSSGAKGKGKAPRGK